MRLRDALTGMVVATAFFAIALPVSAQSSNPGGRPAVVARVDGTNITSRDLDQSDPGKMLNARYRYYLTEREAIGPAVDNQLLENEAKKESLTVDQLLQRHAYAQIKQPSDEALRFYYLGVETTQPYSQIRAGILKHLMDLQKTKARQAYIDKLRAQHKVTITLLPPVADVAVGDAPTEGPSAATVTLIEYADYQCPYCRQIEPSLNKLREEFPRQLRIAFKDFPLPMHPYAEKAAEASHCAEAQGKFWQYHDQLYSENGTDLTVPELKKIASGLHLDNAKFDKCLDSGDEASPVEKDKDEGSAIGLTGTPAIFINGHFVSGAVAYETLEEVVREEIRADSGVRESEAAGGEMQTARRK